MLLVACGDEGTTENITQINQMGIDIVTSVGELPECTKDNEGELTFVKGEISARICIDGSWFASVGSKDTILVAGDTVFVQGGVDTLVIAGDTVLVSKVDTVLVSKVDTVLVSNVDTLLVSKVDTVLVSKVDTVVVSKSDTVYIDEGKYACSSIPLTDNSGIKIICNGDSIGVVLNGENGKDGNPGAAGKDGVGCSVASQTESTVTIKCGTDSFTMSLNSSAGGDEGNEIENASISGVSQKGPFVKGATVTAFELDGSKSLLQTGRTFVGNITQDDGRFSMNNVTLKSSYVRLSANGYYRNEVTGNNSTAQISLNAITDLDARNTVNVNLLTHLESDRVAHLMAQGDGTLKIKNLKKTAESEIFKAFHFDDLTYFGYSEDLDVFGSTEADAALLAISILLQGDRSEAELTGLLSEFSTDLSADGIWNDTATKATIADSALSKDLHGLLGKYRENVEGWGLNSAPVPEFERYIRNFAAVENGLGVCGSDTVKLGTVKHVSNKFSMNYASSYSDSSRTKVRFICDDTDSAKWRLASNIEKDTMGWGNDVLGAVRNGSVNANLTYVYDGTKWRYGTELDSILKELGGKACLTIGDTSSVKYNDVYYVCTKTSYGDTLLNWIKAPDIYNYTYEHRDECLKGADGIYGDGTVLTGGICYYRGEPYICNYVCDNGAFRATNTIESTINRGCVSYIVGEYQLIKGYYKCTESGWILATDKFNEGIIEDERDGQSYRTIGIGTQMWMAQNLNFDPGTETRSWCYGNKPENCEKYGRLYTWATAMDSLGTYSNKGAGCGYGKNCSPKRPVLGICPDGWHLPTTGELDILKTAMGNSPYTMQAKDYEKWPNAEDLYHFTAYPTGLFYGNSGSFSENGLKTSFWSSNEYSATKYVAYYMTIESDNVAVQKDTFSNKYHGLSIRCIKD